MNSEHSSPLCLLLLLAGQMQAQIEALDSPMAGGMVQGLGPPDPEEGCVGAGLSHGGERCRDWALP